MNQIELDRVRASTCQAANERIDREIEKKIEFYARRSGREISRRIQELEEEWSIERWLETNASTLALTGVVLGVTVNRKWLWLSGGVLGFLLLHGVKGWCPPLPILRRLGVRTRGEIDREKFALKILRGDFNQVGEADKAKASPARLMYAVNV
jgi:hypothetical protein